MNSICSRLSKRLLLFPTVGFFRTTFARDHTIRLNTEFLFIHLKVALGMLVASTCSVMLFKRKQKLKPGEVFILFRRNGYLIVSPSNPPTPQQMNIPALSKNLGRNRRDLHSSVKQRSSDRYPFNMTVVDFVNTVPRFPSKATRDGCDARCKPVMYTDQVLFNRCRNYWMWTKKTFEVAFVWKMDD